MISIVNIIPKSLSNETHQDSEPNLTINPAHPLQLVATAFTPSVTSGANAPIYVSTDGGTTWALNATVPGGNTFAGTGDITPRFSTSSNALYAGDLRGDAGLTLNVLRTTSFAGPTVMTLLESRKGSGVDQPWTQAATNAGKDKLYVGNNDFNAPSGKTATIDQSLDALIAAPAFTSVRLEKRATSGQNGPQVRMSVHPSGVIYAAFYGWRSFVGGVVTADVVVVRDDSWGSGANPFTALVDSVDSVAGKRVTTGSTFVWSAQIGNQRTGGDLSIAVDPTDAKKVYLAYADRQGTVYTLHLRRSVNSGNTWSADILTIPNATNPAVAINSGGKVAFLYQQVTGTSPNQRWETHLRTSPNGSTWNDTVLANTPTGAPTPQFQPYLGDYVYLTANGADFYGIFCANNTPDNANFPNGVVYQRNANFTTKTLLGVNGTTPVLASIDPFFFKLLGPLQGRLWHTIRHANSTWQSFFGLVESQEANDPGVFTAIGAAGVANELQMVGVGPGGQLWHTIRHANGSWQGSFGLIEGQESNNPGVFTAVACAEVSGDLHVVSVGPGGQLWHTIRHPNGTWQGAFGLIESQESNNPGVFTAVGCAGVNGELQVVGVGPGGQLWHTIRHANGSWQNVFGLIESQEANNPGAFTAVASASVNNELQVIGVGPGGQLWHTIRHANGSWQGSFGLIEGQESNNPGAFTAIGCAGANNEMQMIGVGPGGKLWHTIRHANGSWQGSFGLVEGQESNDPGAFTAIACAGVGNEMQMVGIAPD